MTDEDRAAEVAYYETLSLAEIVGVSGDDPGELLTDCANSLIRLRSALVEHFAKPPKLMVN